MIHVARSLGGALDHARAVCFLDRCRLLLRLCRRRVGPSQAPAKLLALWILRHGRHAGRHGTWQVGHQLHDTRCHYDCKICGVISIKGLVRTNVLRGKRGSCAIEGLTIIIIARVVDGQATCRVWVLVILRTVPGQDAALQEHTRALYKPLPVMTVLRLGSSENRTMGSAPICSEELFVCSKSVLLLPCRGDRSPAATHAIIIPALY